RVLWVGVPGNKGIMAQSTSGSRITPNSPSVQCAAVRASCCPSAYPVAVIEHRPSVEPGPTAVSDEPDAAEPGHAEPLPAEPDPAEPGSTRSEEHTSELQSREN